MEIKLTGHITLPLLIKRLIRQLAGASTNLPILVEENHRRPRVAGHYGYYTTPSAKTIVRSRNAYGYPVVYHESTRHIAVGRKWLSRHLAFDATDLAAGPPEPELPRHRVITLEEP